MEIAKPSPFTSNTNTALRRHLKASVYYFAILAFSFIPQAKADKPLSELIFANITPWTVDTPEGIAQATKEFNSALKYKKIDGEIRNCASIVRMTLGGFEREVSYGGICDYIKGNYKTRVFICADDIVGHLVMLTEFSNTDKWRVMTTGENCTGG